MACLRSQPPDGRYRKRQPACKPGSVWRADEFPRNARVTTIPLGRPSPDASSDQPGRRPGSGLRPRRSAVACRPYSVLLPAGFAMPLPLPVARCALTAPFHPCLRPKPPAVCFLWHFPWGRPRRTLSGAVLPWSPDFPPRREPERPSGRLARAMWGQAGRQVKPAGRFAEPPAQFEATRRFEEPLRAAMKRRTLAQ